ncbi:MAG: DUF4974 domain-containing protein [Cyclobacteriaceae bacterium]|nr:DUF4974 domain-containing protein [Cyclobacteriaceae bacterium]
MINTQIESIISRYLSGEATPAEQDDFRKWILSDARNREEFDKLASIYQQTKSRVSASQKERVLGKLQDKIAQSDSRNIHRHHRHTPWVKIALGAAAVLLAIFSVGYLYFLNYPGPDSNSAVASALMIKTNPIGQKSKIFLPDGSIVWLNSASTLSYEKEFNDSIRYLKLEGEAFFEVQKDASRPFVVQSGQVSTTALGTAFNIQAYHNEAMVVSLVRGSVNVALESQKSERGVVLTQGQGVRYDPDDANKSLQMISIDILSVNSWKDGQLRLKNASLPNTITMLQRWYGIEIHCINEPSGSWNVNGTFDNEYLENVLNALSFSYGFDYTINGKNVDIKFK